MPRPDNTQERREAALRAANLADRADAVASDMALTPAERLRKATQLSRQAWDLREAFAPVVAERYARRA